MVDKRLKILGSKEIEKRLNRMAYQIYEANFEDEELYLAGIAYRGLSLAGELKKVLERISGKKVIVLRLNIDKKDPSRGGSLETDINLQGKSVIVVDDVIYTGRTMFYCLKPFLDLDVKHLRTLVLVNRNHLEFPIKPDFVGLTLSTTLQEHIEVNLEPGDEEVVLI